VHRERARHGVAPLNDHPRGALGDPDEDTSEQLLNRIQDGRTSAVDGGGATAGVYSHAEELKKHGSIEMYKLGKKLGKRVVADANTIYNYHMNLSVFSLVPDFWGIGQLFSMMPVNQLNEKPTLKGTLLDLTCDSDGKIEKFIGDGETLPLHPLDPNLGGYYVAVLLSGTYHRRPLPASTTCSVAQPSFVSIVALPKMAASRLNALNWAQLRMRSSIGTMRYNVEEDIVTDSPSSRRERCAGVEHGAGVQPLMAKGLTTMPYLNEYKAPKTIT
jgi:arginine decarboxylase